MNIIAVPKIETSQSGNGTIKTNETIVRSLTEGVKISFPYLDTTGRKAAFEKNKPDHLFHFYGSESNKDAETGLNTEVTVKVSILKNDLINAALSVEVPAKESETKDVIFEKIQSSGYDLIIIE